ncbi:hypothetical protein EST38_g14661, partial [Candolleomyces aberdarensis]
MADPVPPDTRAVDSIQGRDDTPAHSRPETPIDPNVRSRSSSRTRRIAERVEGLAKRAIKKIAKPFQSHKAEPGRVLDGSGSLKEGEIPEASGKTIFQTTSTPLSTSKTRDAGQPVDQSASAAARGESGQVAHDSEDALLKERSKNAALEIKGSIPELSMDHRAPAPTTSEDGSRLRAQESSSKLMGALRGSETMELKGGDIVKGALKLTLGMAASLVPDTFKGPLEALIKIVEVVEQVKSNKEEVEVLKARCDLLDQTIYNAIMGKERAQISDDLRNSIGRLVEGIRSALAKVNKEISTGAAAYVLAEDNVEAMKKANQKIGELLQCFWIENHIAGTILLGTILRSIQGQDEWMKAMFTRTEHHQNVALERLKRVPGAAHDSQEVVTKIDPCFEGTRVTLLGHIGCWMSGTSSDLLKSISDLDGMSRTSSDMQKPVYILDGIAGIGKSTVARTVAQRSAGINTLGASFFFSRDSEDRKKTLLFVQTIAYQLARYDASYGNAIAAVLDNFPEVLEKAVN